MSNSLDRCERYRPPVYIVFDVITADGKNVNERTRGLGVSSYFLVSRETRIIAIYYAYLRFNLKSFVCRYH